MNEQRAELRHISWLDLCPWLMLFRCPGLALRVETMFLATVGGVLTSLTWWIGRLAFLPESESPTACAWLFQLKLGERLWQSFVQPSYAEAAVTWPGMPDTVQNSLSPDAGLSQFLYVVVCGLVTLLIWSIVGGAITRSAAVQLARDERITMRQALSFAFGKLASYFLAPLFPLFGTALFVLGVLVFVGLPMNLDIGLIWAGLVWVFVLVFGILVGVLLLGLTFGWPLMWGTISSEGTDAFDALSRSYAYTLQRPLHYLFFVIVAGVLGVLTWVVVLMFGEGVIQLCLWAADWGVFNEERMHEVAAAANGQETLGEPLGSLGTAGVWLIWLCNCALRAVTHAFVYGYFWVSASAMYLLLRREVDHTETDEIFLDDESDQYGLPPLKDDEAGVPQIDEDPAVRPESYESETRAGDREEDTD